METGKLEVRIGSNTLPASIVEHTKAGPNKKATTEPNYLILLSSLLFLSSVGQDSSVGTATRYGLDRSGDRIPVEGEILPRPSRPDPGPILSAVKCVRAFL